MRWLIAAPIVAAMIFGAARVQDRIDDLRDESFDEELLYLPNEKLLDHFTAGLTNVLSDLLWLRTIQYTVKEFHHVDSKYTWLEHLCRIVTRLDPHFVGAYEYSGTLLAAIGNDEAALRILKDGIPKNPTSWELPFEVVKIYVLNRRNEPDSPGLAVHFLNMTAERSDDPKTFVKWAADIQKYHDLDEIGEQIWSNALRSTRDSFVQELASLKITEIKIRKSCDVLTELAVIYKEKLGQFPTSVAQLVDAGLLESAPTHPVKNTYRIYPRGIVSNTYILDADTQRRRSFLNTAMATYKQARGHFPASLEAWAAETGRNVPAHPYEEKQWNYDPETGEVK